MAVDAIDVYVQTHGIESLGQITKEFLKISVAAQRTARDIIRGFDAPLRNALGGTEEEVTASLTQAFSTSPDVGGVVAATQKIQQAFTSMGLGIKQITGSALGGMIIQLDALVGKQGQAGAATGQHRQALIGLRSAMQGAFNEIEKGNKVLQEHNIKLREATKQETMASRGMKGMENRSEGAWLGLNALSAAGAGLLTGFSALSGSIMGVAFSLIFLKFAMVPIVVAAASLTIAIGSLIKILQASISAFTSFQGSLFSLTQVLSSATSGIGAMNFAMLTAQKYGLDYDKMLEGTAILAKAFLPSIKESTKAVADLAATMGGDGAQAARIYTQAIGFERGNLLALREAAIVVDEAMAESFNTMDRHAREMEVNRLILEKYGGAADQFRKTWTGAVNSLKASLKSLFQVLGQPIVTDILVPMINKFADFIKKLADMTRAFFASKEGIRLWNELLRQGRKLMADLGITSGATGEKIRKWWVDMIILSIKAAILFIVVLDKLVLAIRAVAGALRFLLPVFKAFWDVVRITAKFIKELISAFLGLKNVSFGDFIPTIIRLSAALFVAAGGFRGISRIFRIVFRSFGDEIIGATSYVRGSIAGFRLMLRRAFGRAGATDLGRVLRGVSDDIARAFRRFFVDLTAALRTGEIRRIFRTFIDDVARNVREFRYLLGRDGLIEAISVFGRAIRRSIGQLLRDLASLRPAGVGRVFRNLIDDLARGAEHLRAGLISTVGPALKAAGRSLGRLFERIIPSMAQLETSIGKALIGLPGVVLRAIGRAWEAVGYLVSRTIKPWKIIGDLFGRTGEKEVFKSIGDGFEKSIEKVFNPGAIQKIFSNMGKLLPRQLKLIFVRALGGIGLVVGSAIAEAFAHLGINKLPIPNALKRMFNTMISDAITGAFVGANFAGVGAIPGFFIGAIEGAFRGLGFDWGPVLKAGIWDPIMEALKTLDIMGALIKNIFTLDFGGVMGNVKELGPRLGKSLLFMFMGPVSFLIPAWKAAGKELGDVVKTVWGLLPDRFTGLVSGPFEKIWDKMRGTVSKLKNIFDFHIDVLNPVKGLRLLGGGISDLISKVAGSSFSGMWDKVQASWGGVSSFFTDTVPGWFSGIIEGIGNCLSKIPGLSSIWGGVQSAWEGISSFFTETVPNWCNNIGESIENLMSKIPGFSGIWGVVKGAVLGAFAGILGGVAQLAKLPQLIGGVFSGIGTLITSKWGVMWDWAKNKLMSFQFFSKFFANTVPGWFSTVGSSILGVVQAAGGPFGHVWDAVKTAWEAVSGFFTDTVPGWWNNITGAIEAFLGNIPGMSTIWDGVKNAWDAVSGFFMNTVPSWWNNIRTAVTDLYNWIVSNTSFSGIWGVVQGAWSAAATFFSQTVPGWFGAIRTAAENLYNWVTSNTNFGGMWGIVQSAWNGAIAFFGTTVPGWFTSIKNGAVALYDWVTSNANFGGIWGALQGLWSGANTFFGTTVPGWFGNIRTGAQALYDWVTSNVNFGGIWGTVQGLWNGAATFFTTTVPGWFGNIRTKAGELYDWVAGIGGNTFSGMWGGVKLAWEEVDDFFTDTVPGWFSGGLGGILGSAQALWNWVAGTFGGLWNEVQRVWGVVAGFFCGSQAATNSNSDDGGGDGSVSGWFACIKTSAARLYNWVIGTLKGVWDEVKGSWEGIAAFFTTTVPGWFNGPVGSLASALMGFKSWVTMIFAHLFDAMIRSGWNGLKDFITVTVPGWFTGLSLPDIGDLLPDFELPDFPDFTIDLGDLDLTQEGRDAIQSLYDGMTGKWTNLVVPWLTDLPSKFTNAIPALAGTLVERGRAVIQGLRDGMEVIWSGFLGVTTFLGGLPQGILDAIQAGISRLWGTAAGAGAILKGIGRGIMIGLWDGLKEIWSDIWDWFSSLPGWFIDNVSGAGGTGGAIGGVAGISAGGAVSGSWNSTAGMASSGSTGNVYITIEVSDSVIANDASMDQLAATISEKIANQVGRKTLFNVR